VEEGFVSLVILGLQSRILHYGGFGLIVLATYLETGALIGILAPGGETLLFTSGLLCGLGTLTVPVYVLIPTLIIASAMGDFTGYHIGRRIGGEMLERKSRWFGKKPLKRARQFYQKNGDKTFILGRFIPYVRTFNPFIAGASEVPLKRFISYAAIGCVLLVTILVTAGYLAAKQFPEIKDHLGWVIGGIIVIASVPTLIALFRNRKEPEGQ
jgi:membrane-associated protein